MDLFSSPRGIHCAICHGSGRDELSYRRGVDSPFLFGISILISFTVLFEDARERAKELDTEFASTKTLRGPFHGVPVSVKDHCTLLHVRLIHF